MTTEEINKGYFELIRERIRIERVDEDFYPEFNPYQALEKWEEDIVNFVERTETLYDFIRNRLDEDLKRWQENMIMEVSQENFTLIPDKDEKIDKGDIYIGQRFFFEEDREEYEVFSIREDRDPKIYLQGTIYDTEKQIYKSDLNRLIRENKVKELNNLKKEKKMEAPQETKKDFQTQWNTYEFDTTQPLTTKDVYAYLGKGGNAEFISQKMSELAGKEIIIPQFIKNDKLWNEIVKPFRELPQEVQTKLKNELINSLKKEVAKEQTQNSEKTNKDKMQEMSDYYRNQYEIILNKPLNKHDIIAFYFQYGKGAQEKLIELASKALGEQVTIETRKGNEFEEKIINPLKNKGFFAGKQLKSELIESITQQKANRQKSTMQNDNNLVIFDQKESKLLYMKRNEGGVSVTGVSVVTENKTNLNLSNEEWNALKAENKNNWLMGAVNTFKVGDELILGFTKEKEPFEVVKIEENENPLLNTLYLKTSNMKEAQPMTQFDIDLYIAQNKAKQVTPEMKEKGITIHKDYNKFNLEHLKKIDPNTGLTDRNLYAIVNIEMSENMDKVRREMLEKYTGIPFDDLKKMKKNQMIEKVYEIKKEGNGKENELKSNIQKLYISSEAERNYTAGAAYEKYLEGLSIPDNSLWELQHIDMLLLQAKNLEKLLENTPLEQDRKANEILNLFDKEDKDNLLYSKEFHLGEHEIAAKQYLLNTINHSENRAEIKESIEHNLQYENTIKRKL